MEKQLVGGKWSHGIHSFRDSSRLNWSGHQ